jgi:DNA helicase-2/ATP-dependent DNA helicase PcrA
VENVITFSPQQSAFLKWIEEGEGSCVLEAVAGAGKSTTIIEAARRIKGQSALVAFNKKIADELKLKLDKIGLDWKKAQAGTVHSFGLKAYKNTFKDFVVDEHKVKKIVDIMVNDHASPYSAFYSYAQPICSLVGYAKQRALGVLGSIENRALWFDIIEHFDVLADLETSERRDIDADRLVTVAIEALKLNNAQTASIDFDDMIYLPLIHKVRFWQFENIFVDEAQDTNPARRALVRAMLRKGGRVMAVGDRHQAIYGFTGADADSLDLIKADFNAIEMPLSITYRCPKAVVNVARKFVSHITAAATAPDGIYTTIPLESFLSCSDQLSKADAVLCRNTKPLVALAFQLLRDGVPCKVEGRDIGNGLVKLATKWDSIKTLSALTGKLEDYRDREVAKALAKKREGRAQAIEDQVDTLLVIIDRCRALKKPFITDLVEHVEELFADNVRGVLTLSTIHKAKGREWQTVFWLDRAGTLPSKYARQAWQQEQEKNLQYVAATRAQNNLIEVTVPPKPAASYESEAA